MIKILKRLFLLLLFLFGIALSIGLAFYNFSPQFGGSASPEELIAYEKTGHFENGIFINDEAIDMQMDCHSIQKMLKETMSPNPNVAPEQNIQVLKISSESILNKSDTLVRLTWFGHSTFLIEIDGKNILIDPIFGQYAAPHPLLGRKRYNSKMPIAISELPSIDAVIISHDHYDHLDYESIRQLTDKTERFFVPLGVDNHLERWEVKASKIIAKDWWEEEQFKNLTITFTPSRHMSGRGLFNQSSTLWGSWVIKGKTKNIFFSGDGGYGKHFKTIGNRYGPFDIALMECGQYNPLWAGVHMTPEQTILASKDVKTEMAVPIHWGSFTLAMHSWTDPIERFTKAAQGANISYSTPQIGEPIDLGEQDIPRSEWWNVYDNEQ